MSERRFKPRRLNTLLPMVRPSPEHCLPPPDSKLVKEATGNRSSGPDGGGAVDGGGAGDDPGGGGVTAASYW